MPYRKRDTIPFQCFSELLIGKGLTSPKLAKILECSPNTAKKKLKEPERFCLMDIVRISRSAHIPIEDLRDAIKL